MICPNCQIECDRLHCPSDAKSEYKYACPKCSFCGWDNYLVIDNLYAFVSVDENGNEGIVASKLGNSFFPLVGADSERVESLKPFALQMAKNSKIKVNLLKFSNRTLVETYE